LKNQLPEGVVEKGEKMKELNETEMELASGGYVNSAQMGFYGMAEPLPETKAINAEVLAEAAERFAQYSDNNYDLSVGYDAQGMAYLLDTDQLNQITGGRPNPYQPPSNAQPPRNPRQADRQEPNTSRNRDFIPRNMSFRSRFINT